MGGKANFYGCWRWNPSHAVEKSRELCLSSSTGLNLQLQAPPTQVLKSRPCAWGGKANFYLNRQAVGAGILHMQWKRAGNFAYIYIYICIIYQHIFIYIYIYLNLNICI